MTRLIQLFVLGVVATFIAGCSFHLWIKIVPEHDHQTTTVISHDKSADDS